MNKYTRSVQAAALLTLVALGTLGFSPSPTLFADAAESQFVTLDAFSGNPGAVIQVWGGGFASGETVSVFLGNTSGSAIGSATVNPDSLFNPVSVTIPVSSPQGPLAVIARGQTSGLQAANSFFVNSFAPDINVAAPYSAPLSTITVDGTGFASGENVEVRLESASVMAVANSSGSFFGATLVIPNIPAQTYQVHATGQASGAHAIEYLYVNTFYPSLSPSTYYLLAGESLMFNGSGFAAGETITITDSQNSSVTANVTADAGGGFTSGGSLVIPLSFAGTNRTFNAHGQASNGNASVSVTIGNFNPGATPSTYYLLPGETLSFSGSGFAPNESVAVKQQGNAATLATFTTNGSGGFTSAGAFTVPFEMAGGARIFTLTGSQSNASLQVVVTVGSFNSILHPSAFYVQPGSSLTFSGSGFANNETIDVFHVPDSAPLATFSADSAGAFTNAGASTVPFSFAGTTQMYRLTGRSSGTSGEVTIAVAQMFANLNPSSYYIQPGQTLTATGSGFAAGETVNFQLGSATGSGTADAEGNVTSNAITVPFSSLSSLTLTATGAASGATASTNITLAQFYPSVSPSAYYILPGESLTFEGSGFANGETVNIMRGSTSLASASANSSGAFTAGPFEVPFGSSSPLNFTFTGAQGGGAATVGITVGVAQMQVTPSTYYTLPGSMVSFSGTGFAGSETITMNFNSAAATTTIANSSGAFSIGNFQIPYSASGNAQFNFLGGTSSANIPLNITLGTLSGYVGLSNYYAVGGTPITISGGGFGAGEQMNITFGGTVMSPTTADSSGNFSLATTVPFASQGNKIVTARGQSSGVQAQTTFTQAPVHASVQLGSYAGAPGVAVNFIGTGFLPNEPVEITTDRTGATVVHTFTADGSGNFNNSGWSVPAGFTEGNLSLTIRGVNSLSTNSIVYYVTGS